MYGRRVALCVVALEAVVSFSFLAYANAHDDPLLRSVAGCALLTLVVISKVIIRADVRISHD
jgi:hypothetical protein